MEIYIFDKFVTMWQTYLVPKFLISLLTMNKLFINQQLYTLIGFFPMIPIVKTTIKRMQTFNLFNIYFAAFLKKTSFQETLNWRI